MKLSDELTWRGFVNQMTFADITEVNTPRTFYFGVDPSADSMTIGNLAAAMMVRHFIDHGHKAILLVGGATGLVGDPDGKKTERGLLRRDEVATNTAAIAKQYETIFAGKDFEIVDNYDWFKHINYLDFLRDIGKHTSMTQLLDREFVQNRIGEGGSGISYAEFSYSLIQGYDFLHLYREKGATLQLCGADQWGNSITGASLIRKLDGAEAHVYSSPLIVNKATGFKFGKSEGGAIWLDAKKTSPFKFYQFWLNIDDDTAEDLIKKYTLLDQNTVEALVKNHHSNPAARELQSRLAREVTVLVHGASRTEAVERVTHLLFSGSPFEVLSDVDIEALTDEVATVSLSDTMNVVEALTISGAASSTGEAKRLIAAGAISVNNQKISDNQAITLSTLLKKGKNSFVLVR